MSIAALLPDLRYALRQWRKAPGFALTAIFVLALGLGANTAVFTVLDGVLLRPLPYPHANRLLEVHLHGDLPNEAMNYANAKMLQDAVDPGQQPAVVLDDPHGIIAGPGGRYQVTQNILTASLLQGPGVQPEVGRLFRAEEDQPGREQLIVLGYDVWQKLYHGDRSVPGRTLTLRGKSYTIVGVMPRSFSFPFGEEMQVWSPAAITPIMQSSTHAGSGVWVAAFYVQLPEGMQEAQLQNRLAQLQSLIARQYSDPNNPLAAHLTLSSYQASLNKEARKPLWMLYGVVIGIWLLATLNVTSLMLTRAVSRSREMAMRSALGAGRWRLLQQTIVESLLLSFCGAGLGLLSSECALQLLHKAMDHRLPLLSQVHLEWRIVLFLTVLTLLTSILVGIIPGVRTMRSNLSQAMQGGSTTASGSQHRTREVLVVAQLALTLTFLTGAGLFLRTIHALRSVPTGFSEQNVLTGGIILNGSANQLEGKKDSKEENIILTSYMPLMDKLRAIPGVRVAALSSVLPLRSEFNVSVIAGVDGQERIHGKKVKALGRVATSGLTDALGIPILRGRFFNDQDTVNSPVVIVVNQAFVNAYLPGTDPIGHVIGSKASHDRIIGVIGDLKQTDLKEATDPEIYFCLPQITADSWLYNITTAFMQVAIRGAIPADQLRGQFEKSLHQVSPWAVTTNVMTIHEAVENSFGSQKLIASLLEGFAALALLIASVGLYGLLSFSVAQRTREIGVRIALGAPLEKIRSLVLRRAMMLTGAGLILGSILAWFATRLAAGYLFGVKAHDAVTFAVMICTLAVISVAAAWLPARRATSIDPIQALRSE